VPLVIVPVSTTGLDIDRLAPTWEILSDLEATHPAGDDFGVGVLLTKVRKRTRSRIEAREVLTELGYPVLDTEIPLSEPLYAGAFGSMPSRFGAYEDLLGEIK
jgi:chromosome partitioning protein